MTSQAATSPRSAYWSSPITLRIRRVLSVHDLVFLAIAATIIYPIASAPVTSGDLGQWLMVSRFYAGEDVPSYREIQGVAPLVPALLALIRILVSDPVTALNLLRLLVAGSLIVGFYLAGGSIFRSRAAGLLAVTLAFGATERILELFAFGALLQLASIAFMLLGFAALARAAASESHEQLWWTASAVAMAIAVLSHAGSVVIVAPAAASAGAVVLVRNWKRRTAAEWLRLLAPAALITAAAIAYWMMVLVPANQGYGDNPASDAYRGPERLWWTLTARGQLTVWLMLAGAVSLVKGIAHELWRRQPGGYCLAGGWAASTWGVLLFTVASDTPTDYPRFAAPLLAPLAVAAAGGLAEALQRLTVTLERHAPELGLGGAPVLLAVSLLMFVGGREQLRNFTTFTSSYGAEDRTSIEALSRVIETSVPEDQSVLVLEPRDGKWVEGLTGRDALFSNETRYSFREHEWERSVAADAMVRSTTGMVNGLVSAKFIDAARGPRDEIPRELLLGVNHDGEWIDLVRVPENTTVATIHYDGGTAELTLASMAPVTLMRSEDEERLRVQTLWTGLAGGRPVSWLRTVTLSRESHVLDVVDELTTDATVREIRLEVAPFARGALAGWDLVDEGAIGSFRKAGSRQPEATVRTPGEGHLVASEDRLHVRATGTNRVHVQFEARTAGDPISRMSMLFPHQLMEDYHVGAAILRRDGAYEPRLRRLQALGLCPVEEAGRFVLLTLQCQDSGRTLKPSEMDANSSR